MVLNCVGSFFLFFFKQITSAKSSKLPTNYPGIHRMLENIFCKCCVTGLHFFKVYKNHIWKQQPRTIEILLIKLVFKCYSLSSCMHMTQNWNLYINSDADIASLLWMNYTEYWPLCVRWKENGEQLAKFCHFVVRRTW